MTSQHNTPAQPTAPTLPRPAEQPLIERVFNLSVTALKEATVTLALARGGR